MRRMQNRLKTLRKAKKLTLQQLADAVGTTHQQIMRLEKGERKLTPDWLKRLAPALGVAPLEILADEANVFHADSWLAENVGDDTRAAIRQLGEWRERALDDPAAAAQGLLAPVLQIDVKGGMGAGGEARAVATTDAHGNTVLADDVAAVWGLPTAYVRGELGIAPADLRIFQVEGDSMEPTIWSRDYVAANIRDRNPTPPGIFALWDGFGVLVKRLERIMGSDPPSLRIISDNEKHQPVVMTADEVNIIGRVCWFARAI
jgi:transcriptional regulator with XRE-family HTH domain